MINTPQSKFHCLFHRFWDPTLLYDLVPVEKLTLYVKWITLISHISCRTEICEIFLSADYKSFSFMRKVFLCGLLSCLDVEAARTFHVAFTHGSKSSFWQLKSLQGPFTWELQKNAINMQNCISVAEETVMDSQSHLVAFLLFSARRLQVFASWRRPFFK